MIQKKTTVNITKKPKTAAPAGAEHYMEQMAQIILIPPAASSEPGAGARITCTVLPIMTRKIKFMLISV